MKESPWGKVRNGKGLRSKGGKKRTCDTVGKEKKKKKAPHNFREKSLKSSFERKKASSPLKG